MIACNICGSSNFKDFGQKRKNVQCVDCNSLERHRLIRYTLDKLGYISDKSYTKRILHLAPEEMTHGYLSKWFGSGYLCSDLMPDKYPHAQALKLALPRGFEIFPDSYFDMILHNHVLEHIPGDYRDHLTQFLRILKIGGHMIFTVPSISKKKLTIQGGENLPSDADRLRLHGQKDHYKSFGYDFFEWFNGQDGKFEIFSIPTEVRNQLNAPNDLVYVYSTASESPSMCHFAISCHDNIYLPTILPKYISDEYIKVTNWGYVNKFNIELASVPIGRGDLFKNSVIFHSFKDRFINKQPWEATLFYKQLLKDINNLSPNKGGPWHLKSESDLKNRLYNHIDLLWDSIRTHGYRTQENIQSLISTAPNLKVFVNGYYTKLQSSHNIKIGINENNEILFLDGQHRLAICMLQNVEHIPVNVVFYHPHSQYAIDFKNCTPPFA